MKHQTSHELESVAVVDRLGLVPLATRVIVDGDVLVCTALTVPVIVFVAFTGGGVAVEPAGGP